MRTGVWEGAAGGTGDGGGRAGGDPTGRTGVEREGRGGGPDAETCGARSALRKSKDSIQFYAPEPGRTCGRLQNAARNRGTLKWRGVGLWGAIAFARIRDA